MAALTPFRTALIHPPVSSTTTNAPATAATATGAANVSKPAEGPTPTHG